VLPKHPSIFAGKKRGAGGEFWLDKIFKGERFMRKIVLSFLMILCGFSGALFAASQVNFDISAQVNVLQELSIGLVAPSSVANLMPVGVYSDDITAACWKVATSMVVVVPVTTNSTTKKLVAFTKHREQDYWQGAVTSLATSVPINGFVNLTNITAANYANNTIPLKAFADVYKEGRPTTNSAAWVDVVDISSLATANAKVLYQGEITDPTLNVYIRQAWPVGKVTGTYSGKVIFGLVD
jgi:hypothetical protein